MYNLFYQQTMKLHDTNILHLVIQWEAHVNAYSDCEWDKFISSNSNQGLLGCDAV